ncbi:MAG: hypothetical protein H5T86_08270 [Armatimonadetes bacterium]|nr:hypothetical protein [Armatimonadota bacterium]
MERRLETRRTKLSARRPIEEPEAIHAAKIELPDAKLVALHEGAREPGMGQEARPSRVRLAFAKPSGAARGVLSGASIRSLPRVDDR